MAQASHLSAISNVLQENNGCQLLGRPIDKILFDEDGKACGVESEGVQVLALRRE